MTITTYARRNDVIAHEILAPLGEYAAEHDVDAIADAPSSSAKTTASTLNFSLTQTLTSGASSPLTPSNQQPPGRSPRGGSTPPPGTNHQPPPEKDTDQ